MNAEQFQQWIESKTLISLSIVLPRKGQKKLWGRILSYDEDKMSFLFYNDDEKNASSILLSQVDDLQVDPKSLTSSDTNTAAPVAAAAAALRSGSPATGESTSKSRTDSPPPEMKLDPRMQHIDDIQKLMSKLSEEKLVALKQLLTLFK